MIFVSFVANRFDNLNEVTGLDYQRGLDAT